MEELMGNDLLLERVQTGTGDMAEMGVIVKCSYRTYLYSMSERKRLSDEPIEQYHDQYYQIGEGDCVPGLELGLRQSHEGEILKIYTASKFAFGYSGRCYNPEGNSTSKVAPIPPDTDLEFEVEILKHLREADLDVSNNEKCQKDLLVAENEADRAIIYRRYQTLQLMQFRKEAGNRWFSYQEFPRAAKAYSRATQFAEGYFNPDKNKKSLGETVEEAAKSLQEQQEHEQKTIVDDDRDLVEVYIACLNNLAACKISMKDYSGAKDLCVQVLQLSPWNGKALLRAAKATLALDSYDECEACLKKLLSIENIEDSLKTAAKIEYQKLRKAISDYKNHSKEMQKRIVSKLFKPSKEKNLEKIASEELSASAFVEASSATSVSIPEEKEIDSEHNVSAGIPLSNTEKEAATTADISSAPAKVQNNNNNNLVVLLGTSLAVVILSILFALYSR